MENVVKEIINDMLPPDLNKIKKFVDELLEIKSYSRLTNLDYISKNKYIVCPKDCTHTIKKNGHKNGTQRYFCKDCQKSFSLTSNTIAKSSILDYNTIKNILKGFYDLRPLREIALEVKISKTSLFELQIKIYDALDILYSTEQLSGIVEVDEMYIDVNFKGTKKEKMPRKSKKNGSTKQTAGMGLDHICVIAAIDSNDNIILEISDLGSANKDQISAVLDNKIKKNSILVTDSKSSYISFAVKNNLTLVQIPSGSHMKDGYTINNVNQLISEVVIYLTNKRGVSSKHLQQHLNFIKYRKKIKYAIEYLEINESMYKDIISLPINIKSNDVYSQKLPFNIEEYKNWHEEHEHT